MPTTVFSIRQWHYDTYKWFSPGSVRQSGCVLEELTVGLFACLPRYWGFPVDLPDQVIEDLKHRETVRYKLAMGMVLGNSG